MDVIMDKISSGDRHSLSIKDVKSIHKFVSEKLDFNAKVYRLSNEQSEKSRFDRPVIYDMVARRVTICSRGISKAEITKQIFIEAVQRTDRPASGHHLSNAQLKLANERANDFYEEYISKLGD